MTTNNEHLIPESALRLVIEALAHSRPTAALYPEPAERHRNALAAAQAALAAAFGARDEPDEQMVEQWTTSAFESTNTTPDMGLNKYWYGKGFRQGWGARQQQDAQPVADERETFEAWATHINTERHPHKPEMYYHPAANNGWAAWQARAALAAPQAAAQPSGQADHSRDAAKMVEAQSEDGARERIGVAVSEYLAGLIDTSTRTIALDPYDARDIDALLGVIDAARAQQDGGAA